MVSTDKLRELLAAEAAGERLEDAEWGALKGLLASLPPGARRRERDQMHQAAALTQAAFLAGDRGAWRGMPPRLRTRLLDMSRARALDSAPRRPALAPLRRWGWAAAAAMMVAWLATAVWLGRPQIAPQPVAVAAAADAFSLPWSSEIAGYEQVQGEMIWSDALQAGEMRFSGLPANDAAREQYQLWIVDPDRHANPVDGGVFDAGPAAGELVVAVHARLPVAEPVAFAVTLEQAGGVVVSDGPLLLVAATGPRPDASL